MGNKDRKDELTPWGSYSLPCKFNRTEGEDKLKCRTLGVIGAFGYTL